MNYPPAAPTTAHNTDTRFNWKTPIKRILPFSVNGGPCDHCGKTEVISTFRGGSRPAMIKVPQYRHRIIFDTPENAEKWCCTKCRTELDHLNGVRR